MPDIVHRVREDLRAEGDALDTLVAQALAGPPGTGRSPRGEAA